MTLKTTARLALVLVVSAAVISACGRKGDLDPPGAAPVSSTAAGGQPAKQAPEDRPFLLDALL